MSKEPRIDQHIQQIFQIVIHIHIICPCRFHQSVEDGNGFGSINCIAEHPGFSRGCEGPNMTFTGLCEYSDNTVIHGLTL